MSESNFVPTTLDMTRVMDRLNGVPWDPSLLLPATYTHVAIAGTGTYGDVHFCLQNSALLSARSGLTASTDRSAVYEKLIKQLVAIKICCEPDSIKTLQTELEALQTIRTYKKTEDGETCGELFALLGHGQCFDGSSPYIVTSTLPIVCTLESLKSSLLVLPEVFTWLIYNKLTSALHWLEDTCTPGITHGDMHSGNVLVGYPSLHPTDSLPEIKLIDFGRALLQPPPSYTPAALIRYEQSLRADQTHFLRILGRLVGVDVDRPWRLVRSESPEDRGWEWCDLKMEVQDLLGMGEWDRMDEVGKMRGRWDRLAEARVQDVKAKDVEQIWDVVVGVTQGKRDEVRVKIEELLYG